MPLEPDYLCWRRWAQRSAFAMAACVLLCNYCAAQKRLACRPAVEATLGVGDGLHPLPGASPLSAYALTSVQGSFCGFNGGLSSSRETTYFDQRLFGSFTYTLGYADFSAGFVFSETKDKLYFPSTHHKLPHTLSSPQLTYSGRQETNTIKRDRFFLAAGFHPTQHSEINAEWARDLSYRDSIFRVNAVDKLWESRRLEMYGFFGFDRVKEETRYRGYGGDLLNVGMRIRRNITSAWSIYADVGVASASGAESSGSKQNATVLFGVKYRYGYHPSTEVGRIGLRDH